jgi:hypothetical protein
VLKEWEEAFLVGSYTSDFAIDELVRLSMNRRKADRFRNVMDILGSGSQANHLSKLGQEWFFHQHLYRPNIYTVRMRALFIV